MSKKASQLFKIFEIKSHSNHEKYAEEIHQNDVKKLIKVISKNSNMIEKNLINISLNKGY